MSHAAITIFSFPQCDYDPSFPTFTQAIRRTQKYLSTIGLLMHSFMKCYCIAEGHRYLAGVNSPLMTSCYSVKIGFCYLYLW